MSFRDDRVFFKQAKKNDSSLISTHLTVSAYILCYTKQKNNPKLRFTSITKVLKK